MQPGTSHSSHGSLGWRPPPPRFVARMLLPRPGDPGADPPRLRADSTLQTSLRCLCAVCVSPTSLNVGLSSVNSGRCAQPPCFDNLPHSSTTSKKSLLCFHNLTNSFSRNAFFLTTIQIAGGCTPRPANSCTINNFFRCLFALSGQRRTTGLAHSKKVELFPPPDGTLCRERVRAVLAARVKTTLASSEGNNDR